MSEGRTLWLADEDEDDSEDEVDDDVIDDDGRRR